MSTTELSMDEYQRRALAGDYSFEYPTAAEMVLPLLTVVGEVDVPAARWRKRNHNDRGHRALDRSVRTELGDALHYIATVASRVGLTLEEVAQSSLGAMGNGGCSQEQCDENVVMRFEEHAEIDTGTDVNTCTLDVLLNGKTAFRRVSDPADDKNDIDDYWRYDVALNMGYLAVLGWSPVIRSILDSQHEQTSTERLDKFREHTQAVVIEKTLTSGVFAVAGEHSFFESETRVPYYLLKSCLRTTAPYVTNRSVADWEQAILVGHNAFRFLVEHRSGVLVADLRLRTLTPYSVEQYEDMRA